MLGISENSSDTPLARVFELPGEPAIIINGVPELNVDPAVEGNASEDACHVVAVANNENPRSTGFGEWLEGRDVQKLFGQRYYSGTVTEYDKETGWYRVVYEDGDFEDLEWHELQEILQPLDITVPLKSLALKIIRKCQKSESGSGRKRGAKAGDSGGRLRGNSSRR